MLIPLTYTLLQLQQDIRKGFKLKPEEGLFLFVKDHKII